MNIITWMIQVQRNGRISDLPPPYAQPLQPFPEFPVFSSVAKPLVKSPDLKNIIFPGRGIPSVPGCAGWCKPVQQLCLHPEAFNLLF